ncbi:Os05g0596200, partial [Oryza sativa Japonica Group]
MSSSSAAALARGKSGISAAKFEASKGLGAKPKRSASATGSRGKTEKKVYSLPGQKFDPPEEREPLRIFYESLSKQIPSSEMAEFWLMEHGLLSPERAKKAY